MAQVPEKSSQLAVSLVNLSPKTGTLNLAFAVLYRPRSGRADLEKTPIFGPCETLPQGLFLIARVCENLGSCLRCALPL